MENTKTYSPKKPSVSTSKPSEASRYAQWDTLMLSETLAHYYVVLSEYGKQEHDAHFHMMHRRVNEIKAELKTR
jgi:predicted SprT family Zn-dependent metalloprotease